MGVSEKEKSVIGYLRNPHYYTMRKDVEIVRLDELDRDELLNLYGKMDMFIVEEHQFRMSIGSSDEMFVVELMHVKDIINNEIEKRDGALNTQ